MINKIVSCGQTGVGLAALDVAMEMGILHGGWVPKGRSTPSGRLPDKYRLKELSTQNYYQCSLLNIIDSDGTLLISHGKLTGESALTQEMAKKHARPCLHLDLREMTLSKASEVMRSWIEIRGIEILNVEGPWAGSDPETDKAARMLIKDVLMFYLPRTVQEASERLLSDLPLKEKAGIARMAEEELRFLQESLGEYIRRRFGLRSGNQALMRSCGEFAGDGNMGEERASALIVHELWKQLKETHSLRIVK